MHKEIVPNKKKSARTRPFARVSLHIPDDLVSPIFRFARLFSCVSRHFPGSRNEVSVSEIFSWIRADYTDAPCAILRNPLAVRSARWNLAFPFPREQQRRVKTLRIQIEFDFFRISEVGPAREKSREGGFRRVILPHLCAGHTVHVPRRVALSDSRVDAWRKRDEAR